MKIPSPFPLLLVFACSAGAAPIAPEIEKIREIPEPIRAESLKRSGMNTGLDDGLYSPALRADPKAGRNMEALARGQAFLEAMEAQDEAVAATVPPEPPPGTNDNVRVEIMRRVQEEGTQIPVEPAPGIADLPAGAGWNLKGNSELRGKGFLGTLDRSPLRLGVNGQTAIQIISTPFSPSLVMGGAVNFVGEGIAGAAISGGGDQFFPNRVMGDYGVVSGGLDNQAGGKFQYLSAPFCVVAGGRGNLAERRNSTVGGGVANTSRGVGSVIAGGGYNTAEGEFSSVLGGTSNFILARYGVIAGGRTNRVDGRAGFIGAGEFNTVEGLQGVVGGGEYNSAAAPYSTVPGGSNNRAAGKFSFAAGRLAQAVHEGTFVWSDSSSKEAFASTAANQFLIRASGNVGIDNALPQEKLSVAGNIAPARAGEWTLGTAALPWKGLYLAGTVQFTEVLRFQGPKGVVASLDADGKLTVAGGIETKTLPPELAAPAPSAPPVTVAQPIPAVNPAIVSGLVARVEQVAAEVKGGLAPVPELARKLEETGARLATLAGALDALKARPTAVAPTSAATPADPAALDALRNEARAVAQQTGMLERQLAAQIASLSEARGWIPPLQRQMEAVAGQVKALEARFAGLAPAPPAGAPVQPGQLEEIRSSVKISLEEATRGLEARIQAQGEVLKESIAALATNRTTAAAQPAPADASGAQGNEAGLMATVSGGAGNRSTGPSSVISGGFTNIAEEAFAVIGGGAQNRSAGKYATIAGGSANLAQGTYSAIGGGRENQGLGAYVILPGGRDNLAKADYSLAAGRRAKALHKGAFVWADSTDEDFASLRDDQFSVRAAGGVSLASSSSLNSGVELPAGASAWSVRCESRLKANFTEIDPLDSLARVAAMPIRSFSLKSQRDDIRHIGPVAEDFHAHFPYGEDARLINTGDLDGIALSAIQGLNRKLDEKDRQLKKQQEEIDTLKQAVKSLLDARAP